MNKQEITDALNEKHDKFINYLSGLPEEIFIKQYSGKWSAGQQLEHIFLSVKPVRQALSLPAFILRMIWGKSNRPGRNYDTLVIKYQQKLAEGGKAPNRFVPEPVSLERRKGLIQLLSAEIETLNKNTGRFSESELDRYVLPHPLLGKLTLREMLLFTIYHVQHHQSALEKSIAG